MPRRKEVPPEPKPLKEKETLPVKRIHSEARYAIDNYYQIQRIRLAWGNQLRQRGEDASPVLKAYYESIYALEKEIAKYLKKVLKEHAMGDWLIAVKGIGPVLGAALVSFVDIEKAEHASSVWKFCGLAVDNETGQADRRRKGVKCAFSPMMKGICWKIGESFVKSKGEYRTVYETSREFYRRKFPERIEVDGKVKYNDGHIHNMAKRRTVKIFLSKFWEEWRRREGLPVSDPFAHRTS